MNYKFEFTCPLENGLHARPASWLEKVANGFDSEILIANQRNGKQANVKSVLSLIAVDMKYGDRCIVNVSGSDEKDAFGKLKDVFLEKLADIDTPIPEVVKKTGEVVLGPALESIGVEFVAGSGVVEGVGAGRVVFIDGDLLPEFEDEKTAGFDSEREFGKINRAFTAFESELKCRLVEGNASLTAQVLESHLSIIRDVEFRNQMQTCLTTDDVSAGVAISNTARYFTELLRDTGNPILLERSLDIVDVCSSLISEIYGKRCKKNQIELSEPSVCVALNMTPGDFLKLDKARLKGMVLCESGGTSHTVILARSYGIPTVTGIQLSRTDVSDGSDIIVDGNRGIVITNITAEVSRFYGEEIKREGLRKQRVDKYVQRDGRTAEGRRIEVAANVASVEEIENAVCKGAEGVGLLRTELLFMEYDSSPSEEEQFRLYKRAVESMGGGKFLIRTLDIGGDKPLKFMQLPKEDNPFLGYRAVRLYKEYESLFREQLRAIVRASAYGNVHLLVPMICCVEEVRWVRQVLNQVQCELRAEGVAFDEEMPVGIMVEIPSVAFIINQLAEEVDFFSIGTNDLAQYFLGVDRCNEKVANLYDAAHPAFITLLKKIVEDVHASRKWIGMCGEMAGQSELLPLLVGLELDEISLSSSNIPMVKEGIGRYFTDECKGLLEDVVACRSVDEVRAKVSEFRRKSLGVPLLDETLIVTESTSTNKHEVIKELVDCMYVAGRTEKPVELEEAIWQREKVYSTGLGYGFAIPHCKCSHVSANSIGVLKLRNDIDWGSVDGKPVKVVVLLAINDADGAQEHMKIFTKLARKVMHEDFRAYLEAETDAEKVMSYLRDSLGL